MSSVEESTHEVGVKLLDLEIVRKDEFIQWLKDPNYVGEASSFAIQQNISESSAGSERFDISHLNQALAALEMRLPQLSRPLYSYADISDMVEQPSSRVFEYMLHGLKWECECSVRVRETINGNLRKTLVIPLPNDGYFYIDGVRLEEFLRKRQDDFQNTHRQEMSVVKFNKTLWDKIQPFKRFMVSWFGESYNPEKMKKTILYHTDANRLDICMRHMDSLIDIEFSFVHSYPVVLDDDWWDQI